jgi:Mrp family chromosome partitioning ATPase
MIYINAIYNTRWIPVYADREQRLSVMSIAFLLDDKNTAVVWRGPKKNGTYIKGYINEFW